MKLPFNLGMRTLIGFLFLFVLFGNAQSQEKTGLQGIVKDPFNALIVGAEVTLSTGDTSLKAITDREGRFFFSNINSGKYLLTIKAKGFADSVVEEIELSGKNNAPIEVEMKVALDEKLEVSVDNGKTLNTDSSSNINQTVLRNGNIEILPDDPEALAAALQALTTSPGALDGSGQIYVDGLTGGRVPPKASISEVRINQNPLNAEFDRVGFNRIDIFTKPGADKIRGNAFFNFSDDSLVARNPFILVQSPYQTRLYGGTLSGSIIPNKSSFFVDLQKRDEDNAATINARILDQNFTPTDFFSAIPTPVRFTTFSPRLDYQLNQNNTLIGRYAFTENKLFNRGTGDFALPDRAYSSVNTQHLFQIIENAVINPVTSNEFRVQFTQDVFKQNDTNTAPGIIVQDAFQNGGSGVGITKATTRRIELQNYITTLYKGHTIRFGIRLRGVFLKDVSLTGSNGIFNFGGGSAPQLNSNNEIVLDGNGNPVLIQISSLERYRRTVLFQSLGLTADEIRRRGGGATQLAIVTGNPEVKVNQFDIGFFFQDEWRLRPNLSVGAGFRYENQSNISSNADIAPRVFFAWAPGKNQQPELVIRGGFGLFYERTTEQVFFQARRFAGNNQFRYYISDPALLNLFPSVPSQAVLSSLAGKQSITSVADNVRSPYSTTFILNVERKLPHNIQGYIYAYTYRTHNSVRLRNINAPLPGTFILGTANTGVRPFPNLGEVLSYESSGNFSLNQATFGLRKFFKSGSSIFTSYILGKARNDSESLPANSYNLDGEFGRASFDVRQRFIFGGNLFLPKLKVTLTPFIIANTGRPFNITTGIDNNGDSIFADRPAFADSDTLPQNLVVTEFGRFDLRPATGKPLIPRNYGQGPGFFSVNLGLLRNFNFKLTSGKNSPKNQPNAQSNAQQPNAAERKITLGLSVQIQNLFNRTNFDVPNGNLSSPFFGQSIKIVPSFGTGIPGAFNRRVEIGARLNF